MMAEEIDNEEEIQEGEQPKETPEEAAKAAGQAKKEGGAEAGLADLEENPTEEGEFDLIDVIIEENEREMSAEEEEKLAGFQERIEGLTLNEEESVAVGRVSAVERKLRDVAFNTGEFYQPERQKLVPRDLFQPQVDFDPALDYLNTKLEGHTEALELYTKSTFANADDRRGASGNIKDVSELIQLFEEAREIHAQTPADTLDKGARQRALTGEMLREDDGTEAVTREKLGAMIPDGSEDADYDRRILKEVLFRTKYLTELRKLSRELSL